MYLLLTKLVAHTTGQSMMGILMPGWGMGNTLGLWWQFVRVGRPVPRLAIVAQKLALVCAAAWGHATRAQARGPTIEVAGLTTNDGTPPQAPEKYLLWLQSPWSSQRAWCFAP